MATLKKVSGTDITYLFNGSYQQLYATMIRFPLGEQKAKMFAEVDGQERCEEVEGEKEREICYHHLAIVLIPKSFHDVVGKNTAKLRKKF